MGTQLVINVGRGGPTLLLIGRAIVSRHFAERTAPAPHLGNALLHRAAVHIRPVSRGGSLSSQFFQPTLVFGVQRSGRLQALQ